MAGRSVDRSVAGKAAQTDATMADPWASQKAARWGAAKAVPWETPRAASWASPMVEHLVSPMADLLAGCWAAKLVHWLVAWRAMRSVDRMVFY
jgi:hypothetical protein